MWEVWEVWEVSYFIKRGTYLSQSSRLPTPDSRLPVPFAIYY
ncbi:hypothetical protein BJP36_41800 [Moorena producens JHB]|uniref:Uncharacterized protein n=1 Tax=Moorena producens (strain JHB) TaxID=1454205 RepID=A0A9Q9UVJ5_MOOP1|nr:MULTISPECIES: hypothetical protein [Moorena]WAN68901.1 hypothetical protein BJP36_41800 [Moorena producens JHB]